MSQVQDDFDHTDMVVISDDCSSTESESSDNNDGTSSCRTFNKSSAVNTDSSNTITPSIMTATNNAHPVSFAAARNVVNPNAIDSWIRSVGPVLSRGNGPTGVVTLDNTAASISQTKNDIHTANALSHNTQTPPSSRRDEQTGVKTKEDHSTTFKRAETLNKYATFIHQPPDFQDAKDDTIHQHGKTPTWDAGTRENCATPPQQPTSQSQPQPAEMPDDEDPQSKTTTTTSTQDVANTPDAPTGTKRSLPPIVQRYERSPMQKVSRSSNDGVRRGETHVTAKDWVHWIRRDLDMPEFEVVWGWLNEMPSDTPSKRLEKSLARSLRRLARHYPTEQKEKYMRWHASFMHDLGLSSR